MLFCLVIFVACLAVAFAAVPDKFSEPAQAIFSRAVQRVFQSSLQKAFQQNGIGVLFLLDTLYLQQSKIICYTHRRAR
jgi:hypothetical protein